MKETEIEYLLRSMTPASPSSLLEQRVKRDLQLAELFRQGTGLAAASSRRTTSWAGRAAWCGLGAAAALMISSVLQRPDSVSPVVASISTPSLNPPVVTSSREWVSMDDGGIVYSEAGEPEHLVSVTSVERHQWVDPKDGAEYVIELPRQESMYLPVSVQ